MYIEREAKNGLDLVVPPSDMNAQNPSSSNGMTTIDSLQLSEQIHRELAVFEPELPNIALDDEELATLNALIKRYDQVIHDLDLLNDQIENLLSEESIKGCDS
jgi:hypothetical protein